eukprot:6150292-Alexandrium_andersonii.AAC.1
MDSHSTQNCPMGGGARLPPRALHDDGGPLWPWKRRPRLKRRGRPLHKRQEQRQRNTHVMHTLPTASRSPE